MFLRRLLKSSQISSSVGRIRTISSSPNVTTPPTPSTSEFVGRSTFRKVAETIAPSVVNIYAPNDDLYGSGILFGEGDKIITCGHVVRNFHKFRTSSVYRSKTIEV
ncbi:hypothetical protein HID58_036718 [Brassica napus]|uniref:Serine protease n=2 Tax=Brassica TaxID=3705 RepID=A0ABQ8C8K6_BRANA|nr:hypothetical protein HID58_036718 [Brassica napus]